MTKKSEKMEEEAPEVYDDEAEAADDEPVEETGEPAGEVVTSSDVGEQTHTKAG